eukprot:5874341-Amphidinium_carterae.1
MCKLVLLISSDLRALRNCVSLETPYGTISDLRCILPCKAYVEQKTVDSEEARVALANDRLMVPIVVLIEQWFT